MPPDLRAASGALQQQLRAVRCPHALNVAAAEAGCPAALLPSLGYLLTFSKHVALLVAQLGLRVRDGKGCRMRLLDEAAKGMCAAAACQQPAQPT